MNLKKFFHKHCDHTRPERGYTYPPIKGHGKVPDIIKLDSNANIILCCKCDRQYVFSYHYHDYIIKEGSY
jgi:hypothetical protein